MTEFLQTGDQIPLTVGGPTDVPDTPFESLETALENLQLSTSLTGLNVPPIITHVNVIIPATAVLTNEVCVNFDVSRFGLRYSLGD